MRETPEPDRCFHQWHLWERTALDPFDPYYQETGWRESWYCQWCRTWEERIVYAKGEANADI